MYRDAFRFSRFVTAYGEFAYSMRINALTIIGGIAAPMSNFSILIPLLN